jgi:hypothetical protein
MGREHAMIAKKKSILDRIAHIEDAIAKGREYLENGEHAHWHGFRPLFDRNVRDGRTRFRSGKFVLRERASLRLRNALAKPVAPGVVLAPHRDWVRNVFLPREEAALGNALRQLESLG